MIRSIYFLLFVCFASNASAIVTVSNLRFDNTNSEFVGSFEADIRGASGNTDNSALHLGTNLIWRRSHYINLMIIGYDYGESNNKRNINKTFIHARHIQQYNSTFDWEIFTQIEQNEFTRLSRRKLLGGGIRLAVATNGYLGIGAFYFTERLDKADFTTDNLNDDGIRYNAYWSGDYNFNEATLFESQLYYQPKSDDFNDYRVLFNGSIKVNISQNLGLKISIAVIHDNRPPQNIEQTDFSYRSGIEYNF